MKFLNFLFIFYILSLAPFAQGISVFSKVDRSTIPINQTLTFIITIQYKGDSPKELKVPDLSELINFNVLNRWSGSQSSINIINGRMEKNQSLEYSYQLQAQKKGTLEIESLGLEINGKIYKTKPVTITVIEEQDHLPPSNSNPFFSKNPIDKDPFFNSFFNNSNIFSKRPNVKQNVKVQMSLDKKTAYVGEAISAHWTLLVSSGNIRYEINKSPKLQGFWKEFVSVDPQGQFLGTSVVDDVLYRKTLIDSMILFPLKTGKLFIDSYSIRIGSMFGFGRQSQIKKASDREITVKPLPEEESGSFSGAVGSFTVTASLDGTETKVNEPLAYYIKFEGDGHPQFIKLPKIPFPPSVKTYSPVEKSKFNPMEKNFKSYEIIFIPKTQGRITIPSFKISTFDPKYSRYIYHKMPSFEINVLKGDQALEEGLNFFDDENQVDKTDRFKTLQEMPWPSFLNHKFLMKFWWFFYTCILAAFLIGILWSLKRKQKTVREKLKKGLREVERLIENKKCKSCSIKLISLVYLVLYQFDSKNISSDWTDLIKKLPPSFYEKHGAPLISLMKNLEKLSFAPEKLSDKEALEKIKLLYQETASLLFKLVD